jgi:hypothetical protein
MFIWQISDTCRTAISRLQWKERVNVRNQQTCRVVSCYIDNYRKCQMMKMPNLYKTLDNPEYIISLIYAHWGHLEKTLSSIVKVINKQNQRNDWKIQGVTSFALCKILKRNIFMIPDVQFMIKYLLPETFPLQRRYFKTM